MRQAALAAAVWLSLPAMGSAHRLDEYLQASRVAIARQRVDVELDLTPGVAVAPQVIAAIDRDRDGRMSESEAEAYAAEIVGAISLELDGRPMPLALARRSFPDVAAMHQGLGTIRLEATAVPAAAAAGSHRLHLHNGHRPDIGVYLANALVPADRSVTIETQTRDPRQQDLIIAYRIGRAWVGPLCWTGAGGLIIVLLVVIRRTSARAA